MTLSHIALVSLAALLTDNIVLGRILGVGPMMRAASHSKSALRQSLAVAAVMVAASALLWPMEQLLLALNLPYMRTVVFALVLAGLVPLIDLGMSRLMPALRAQAGDLLPHLALNSAVLGIALLSAQAGLGFGDSLKTGLSAAAGFALVSMLFASIREKVDIRSDCPRAFEGVPIALVSAGLLALALMGFKGLVL